MRSVVKARFIKGKQGAGKICAHVDYIQYRGGHDKGPRAAREIFDQSRDRVASEDVKAAIRGVAEQSLQKNPVIAHKLILSPGLNAVNLNDYTREIMDKLGSEKGLDLKWYAVKHENTDNNHAHVVVLGRDQNGVEVSFSRRDLDRVRDLGDRYIEREHYLERYLQRESDRVLLGKELKYERQGDHEFQRLVGEVYSKREDKEKSREAEQERDSDRSSIDRSQGRDEQGERGAQSSSAQSSSTQNRPSKKRRYIEWSKDRAVEKLSSEEKIVANGKTYSRFSSSEELRELDDYLKADYSHYLPKEEYGKLGSWLMTKEKYGDDCFEKQERYRHDKKFNKGLDKEGNAIRDIEEHRLLDKQLRRNMDSSDSRQQKLSRQEFKYVSQGRLTEEHIHYSSIQNIARLEDLKARYPDRAEEFDTEIAATRKYDSEQLREGRGWQSFDDLVGGKPAERAKGARLGRDMGEAKEARDMGDEVGREPNAEAGREQGAPGGHVDSEVDKTQDKASDKSNDRADGGREANQRDASANAFNTLNSLDAHGRAESAHQDQQKGEKQRDRGDDDSEEYGR